MPAHASHPSLSQPRWQRWLGLSEVWAGGALSARVLVLLRWMAAAGQGLTLLIVSGMGVEVPWAACGGAVLVTLVTNALLEWWLRQIGWQLKEGFFHLVVWDALTLTFLLHWTGGLQNPFALFYLVQLTLAAVALRASAVIGLGLLTTLACAWLWWKAVPLHMADGSHVPETLLTQGIFVALVLAGGFVLALLLALRRRSHRLQRERERLRAELDSRERFLSVAALATGFAHELSTPLGTIALAAEEMRAHPDAATAAVIAHETTRCQQVLQRLRELGQEATGLSAAPCAVSQVVETALNELPQAQRSRVQVSLRATGSLVACAGLREALLVLLRNALLASADADTVSLIVYEQAAQLRFMVEDRGAGFSPEMLRHWGEPFRTSRDPGIGMGLGLFFVRRLAASMHGSVEVANQPEGGARVTLLLPRHSPQAPAAS
ncbi:ATP-binding protein [Prosthecobacter fluviatilis]|uniref:ATP-binding protein n=1 Tax=Prosthecobacter fluviatilis TaxID=445931 RepID=UPI003671AE8B